ncbi:MAG: DUF4258 domain-containing protein [Flavisolibacter sp.]|jgi:hypothetical protein
MKKLAPFLILVLLALLVIVIKKCKGEDIVAPKKSTASAKKVSKRNHGFDRTLSYIEYTAHAKCRMQCRHISQQDIEDIMRSGDINYSKSDVNEAPCPVYAVQGYTRTNEHLRVIFGQCDYKTKVITCYNLDEDFECHCPGDEKKTYQ